MGLAVPLACRIHEGLVFSNRCRRTQLDKLVGLIFDLALRSSFYLVADAYYASRKVAGPLLEAGHHLVSRLRCTATAYEPAPRQPHRRGRPKLYGLKIKLMGLTRKWSVRPVSRNCLPARDVQGRLVMVRSCG